MRANTKKVISIFAVLCLVLSVIPVFGISSSATSFSNGETLTSTSSGAQLSSGTYYVTSSISITNSAGGNGISVASGATVTIYINAGCTLTARGGAGSGRTPGGAGIYVPSNAAIIFRGQGSVVAVGGNGGGSASGANGGGGQLNISGNWYQGGTGGAGGAGGGGAGAGIGGNGGTGGTGGAAVAGPWDNCEIDYDHACNRGNAGVAGSAGAVMGSVYVLDAVSVSATAGSGVGGAAGGAAGGYMTDSGSGWSNDYCAGGGGGGGGGGSTVAAAAIGGGAGGAGGGASGCSGGVYSTRSNGQRAMGGYGGYGATGGSQGANAYFDTYIGENWHTAPNYGGGRGAGGSGGNLYVASTAYCSAVGGGDAGSGYGTGASRHDAGTDSNSTFSVSYDTAGGTLAGSYLTSYRYGVGGVLPTAANITKTGYTFTGWKLGSSISATTNVSAVDYGNKSYVATWKLNVYNINFLNGDGSVLYTAPTNHGSVPVFDEEVAGTPVKAADVQYTYTWAGTWAPALSEAVGVVNYVPVFNSTVNQYTVTFLDDDGGVLQQSDWDYGVVPTYDADANGIPSKLADVQYNYAWNGWTETLAAVTGDVTYYPSFSSTLNKYTITFKNYNGDVLLEKEVEYGTVPVYDGATPEKAFDNTYHYVFNSVWDTALAEVTGEAEYTAQFTAVAHSFVDYVYDNNRSCDTNGTKTAVCVGCAKTDTVDDPENPSYGGVHVFETYVPQDNATCVLDETEISICTRCNIATDERPIPGTRLGHEFLEANYVYDDNAACLEDGTETAVCTRCDVTDTRTVPGTALGHTYGDYVPNGDATCTENETETATCIRCDAFLTREIADSALGHFFGDWYFLITPDCTNEGSRRHVCSVCQFKEDEVVAPNGHDYINKVILPTCTGRGFIIHTCSVCGDKFNDSFVEPTGHYYGTWYTVKEATCTADGREARKCSACSKLQFRDIDSHHTPSADDPNICSVCGIVIHPVVEPTPEPEVETVYCCDQHNYPNTFIGKILAFFCKLKQFFTFK